MLLGPQVGLPIPRMGVGSASVKGLEWLRLISSARGSTRSVDRFGTGKLHLEEAISSALSSENHGPAALGLGAALALADVAGVAVGIGGAEAAAADAEGATYIDGGGVGSRSIAAETHSVRWSPKSIQMASATQWAPRQEVPADRVAHPVMAPAPATTPEEGPLQPDASPARARPGAQPRWPAPSSPSRHRRPDGDSAGR
jgi:hypothetical protein